MIPIGYDSYYYLALVAGREIQAEPNFIFAKYILPLLQDLARATSPEIVVWLSMLFLFLVALFSVSIMAWAVFGKQGIKYALLFLCSAPLFLLEMLNFENDQFAYAVIFISFSLYFLYKFKWKNKVLLFLSLLLLVLAYFIWKGALAALIAILLVENIFLLAFGAIYIFLFNPSIVMPYILLPLSNSVPEEIPLIALPFAYSLSLGILPYLKNRYLQRVLIPTVLLLLLLLAMPKFAMLCVPFLVIGLVALAMQSRTWKIFLCSLSITLLICSPVMIFVQPPQPYQFEQIDFAIKKSNEFGLQLKNDWEYGYWIYYLNGIPSRFGGAPMQQDFNHSIALTVLDIDCNLLQQKDQLKVYKCP